MLQNWKVKLVYIGFGTVFGCLCTIMGMLASSVTAQRDKFGEIECTKLAVVDQQGNPKVELSSASAIDGVVIVTEGRVNVYGRSSRPWQEEPMVELGVYGKRGSRYGRDGRVVTRDSDGKRKILD